MSDSIELRLFGYPELRLHGQPVTPALPHKALALLAYLALAAQPVGRETIAAFLWPDAPAQTAKHSLRNLLSLLRKVVGDGIESNHRTIHLSTTQFQHIDVVAFEQGISALKKSQPGGQSDLGRWQTTLDLYRGDFLEGFYIQQSEPFEEWTGLRREYLRQQLLTQLLALSEAYAANNAPELALACLDRIFAIAPEHEAAYRWKIQLLANLGRRTEALQYYERYQQLFAVEPNITLRPASSTLYQPTFTRGANEPVPSDQPPSLPIASVSMSLITNSDAAAKPMVSTPLFTSAWGTFSASNGAAIDHQTERVAPASLPSTPATLRTSTLPPQSTTFVGRQTELNEIAAHLSDPACRMLTLLGPGGMGKSRLALAVAENQQPAFAHGVTYVSLANIRPDEFNARINPLLATIAEALAQPLTGRTAPVQQLVAYLAPQHRLLVIDNLEHMVDTVEPLSELLAGAPGLKVLITSRARLNLQEEWIYTVGGLTYPPLDPHLSGTSSIPTNTASEATAYSAPALFAQRARQVQANFDLTTVYPAVVRICQLVEGMPLALELAATWVRQMPCGAIADEIARGIDLLATNVRNVSVRHRSMRAVFDHTWTLLSVQEQQLLAKLSVFRGGFTREAAIQVANASLWLLAGLVDKSLLTVDTHGRYAVHELLRQYMTEQLVQQGTSYEQVYEQHCHYYLTLLAQQESLWQGHDSQRASTTIQTEIDNIRAAWHYAVEGKFFLGLAPTMYTVWWFFELHGWLLEAQELLGRAIAAVEQFLATGALPATAPEKRLLGQLKTGRGWFQNRQGLPEQGYLTLQEGVALLQKAGGNRTAAPGLRPDAPRLRAPSARSISAGLSRVRRECAAGAHHWRHLVLCRQFDDVRTNPLADGALCRSRRSQPTSPQSLSADRQPASADLYLK